MDLFQFQGIEGVQNFTVPIDVILPIIPQGLYRLDFACNVNNNTHTFVSVQIFFEVKFANPVLK